MPEARENAGDQVVISSRFASDWCKRGAGFLVQSHNKVHQP